MSSSIRRFVLVAAAAAVLGAGPGSARAAGSGITLSVGPDFAAKVDLSAIRVAAVQEDGRIKTIDSLAREKLRLVNASADARAVDPVLWFFDLILAPEHYAGTNVVHIKKKAFRVQLLQTVRTMVPPADRTGVVSEQELERILEDGLVSTAFLDHPAVTSALAHLDRDLMRTSKEVNALQAARAYSDAGTLVSILRVVPPAGARDVEPWLTIREVASGRGPHGMMPAAMGAGAVGGAVDAALRDGITRSWNDLGRAWRTQDPVGANRAFDALAQAFAASAPAIYPSGARRSWEHWYYEHDKLTAGWLIYFFAIPFLLMAIVYRLRWARVAGVSLFVAGFLVQTFAIALRWWLAGRIPNANMFEAITASAWLGGLVAVALELWLRRWPVKNLPALAASCYAMLVLMTGRYVPIMLPASFNNDIGTVMPVLDRTVWLYIHTNMIIASYALIFFASVTAVLYLALRFAVRFAPAGRMQVLWAGANGPAAVKGGAGAIILGRGLSQGDAAESGLARSLDGATMIFLELAFVTLWLGTLLGAVWAYFSWGRPWGWDPKEVFALNTWIVFLVLVHVRLKVKDKALWTAILAIIGCAVMLFNWIAVNFVIVGLHSYA